MWWDELNDPDCAPRDVRDKPRDRHEKDKIKYYFNSITSQKPILNAITGETYYHVVNKKRVLFKMNTSDEGRFFVVVTQDPVNPKESVKLFFDSPGQYEWYTGRDVDMERKEYFKERKGVFGETYESREKY
jgi:hypothetical protein